MIATKKCALGFERNMNQLRERKLLYLGMLEKKKWMSFRIDILMNDRKVKKHR